MTVDIQKILKALPHRYPFLLVDRVKDIVSGKSATGIKNVTMNEPHFPGHFPNHPVMPGVLIIEAMAQTSAVLVCETLGEESNGKLVYLTSVDETKFRKTVIPGDQLLLKVVVERSRGQLWKLRCIGEVDGNKVAEALISAMIMDQDSA